MKLRNKKTGEIGELAGVIRLTVYEPNMPLCGNSILGQYDSLAELNEEWEDYKPTEPFIKDEKIRKAVRAWAEVCDVERCYYDGFGEFAIRQCGVKFRGTVLDIKSGNYTIAELCGEEEE